MNDETPIDYAEIARTGKDRLTRRQARQIARRMRMKRGGQAQAYKCEFCRGWHVGNRPFGLRKRGMKW